MIPLTENQARLADRACSVVPAATVFVAMVLMTLPLPLAIGVAPNFAFLFIIIWSSLQPRLMPVWLVFVLGALFDLISALPLGHMALLFTVTAGAVRMAEDRFEGHGLLVDWAFIALVLVLAALVSWQLCAFVGNPTTLWPLLVQAGVTILAYPLAVAIVAAVQRKILLWAA